MPLAARAVMISLAVSLLPLVEDDAVNWFGWVEFEKANKAGNLTPLTPSLLIYKVTNERSSSC